MMSHLLTPHRIVHLNLRYPEKGPVVSGGTFLIEEREFYRIYIKPVYVDFSMQ
jgi:hypothetical protein